MYNRETIVLFAAALLILSCGCALPNICWPGYPPPELVLAPGTTLQVTHETASITIIAGRKFNRRCEWDDCSLTAHPCPRHERWYGNLGIYDAAPGFAYLFAGCGGISRPVVEEGQQHFANKDDVIEWLTHNEKVFLDNTLWTNDGLLVEWAFSPGRSQLGVEIHQICINGEKPKELPGSSDDSFRLSNDHPDIEPRLDCVKVSDEVMAETMRVWREHWREWLED